MLRVCLMLIFTNAIYNDRCIVDTLPEITNLCRNFYRCNAVVPDFCDGKTQNKIAVTFFS